MSRRKPSDKISAKDNWIIEDLHGDKIRASDARRLTGELEGLYTHWRDWAPSNPQLNPRSKADTRKARLTRHVPDEEK